MDRIVLACDKNLKGFADHQISKLTEFGYSYSFYDLGGVGYGEEFKIDSNDIKKIDGFVRCHFKPKVIKKTLEEHDKVIYLDVDAVMNRPLEIEWDFDIGVTIRTAEEVIKYSNNDNVGAINTGVIFFKKSDGVMHFLDQWIEMLDSKTIEQNAFNRLIRGTPLKVKKFPTLLYNNYYTTSNIAYITHYKGLGKQREWLKK